MPVRPRVGEGGSALGLGLPCDSRGTRPARAAVDSFGGRHRVAWSEVKPVTLFRVGYIRFLRAAPSGPPQQGHSLSGRTPRPVDCQFLIWVN
jgi:hypothetical protein